MPSAAARDEYWIDKRRSPGWLMVSMCLHWSKSTFDRRATEDINAKSPHHGNKHRSSPSGPAPPQVRSIWFSHSILDMDLPLSSSEKGRRCRAQMLSRRTNKYQEGSLHRSVD